MEPSASALRDSTSEKENGLFSWNPRVSDGIAGQPLFLLNCWDLPASGAMRGPTFRSPFPMEDQEL